MIIKVCDTRCKYFYYYFYHISEIKKFIFLFSHEKGRREIVTAIILPVIASYRKWRCDIIAPKLFSGKRDRSKFLINIPRRIGRLIPSRFGGTRNRSRVCREQKRALIRRSIARAVLKGGPRESAAKGRARECTWRSFSTSHTRVYVV